MVALGALASAFASAAPPKASARDHALRLRLEHVLASPAAAGGFWGVYVYSLDRQRVLYDHNGERWFTPASNAKLFTLAAALQKLGPQYRFHTVVESAAAPNPAGVISGDIVLVGTGDPSLSGRSYPYQYHPSPPRGATLELPYDPLLAANELARQLVARGVTRIEGGVIGDDRYFADDPYGRGWAADDEADGYGAPISALTMNDNERFAEIVPGRALGEPAQVRVLPAVEANAANAASAIENHVVTGTRTAISISGVPGRLRLDGEVAWGSAGALEGVPVADPALYAAELLRQALIDQGVTVTGPAQARHRALGQPAITSGGGFQLANRASPPLWELLQTAAKVSDNQHAELFLRTLGKLQGTAQATAGDDGEAAAGERAVRSFLQQAGLGADDAELVDGSGLSRLDLVTPAGVVRLLRYMDAQPDASTWRSLLPVAGEDGTLAHRFRGTAAQGRMQAKTGSLTHVRCLSGYVTTRAGERLAFSILANNQGRPSETELDRLALALVE